MRKDEVIALLKKCKHRDWILVIEESAYLEYDKIHEAHIVRFHWSYFADDSKTGQRRAFRAPTHRIFLDRGVDDREVVQEVRRSIHEIVLHEADEFFRVDGVMVFDPHIGDPGYEPERIAKASSYSVSSGCWSASGALTNSCDPSGVGFDGRVYEIDADAYTRYR